MAGNESVIRYVVTHLDKATGLRTLIGPAQGRFTYATEEEAARHLDDIRRANDPQRLAQTFGMPLRVTACPCWPGHFDPKTIYPEED